MAGRHGTIKLMEKIDKNKLVYNHPMYDGKDINDLTKEEFLKIPSILR